jgi:hypothetical protein
MVGKLVNYHTSATRSNCRPPHRPLKARGRPATHVPKSARPCPTASRLQQPASASCPLPRPRCMQTTALPRLPSAPPPPPAERATPGISRRRLKMEKKCPATTFPGAHVASPTPPPKVIMRGDGATGVAARVPCVVRGGKHGGKMWFTWILIISVYFEFKDSINFVLWILLGVLNINILPSLFPSVRTFGWVD